MRNKTLIWLAAALIVAIPAVSFAGDRFTDVPSSNIFHSDITWLADQGVTKGCNPPANTEFCPDDPVTRQQMAAFMRRFANTIQGTSKPLLVGSEGSNRAIVEDTWVVLDSFTVNAPTGGGALLLNGTAVFFIQTDTDLGAVGILEVTVDEGCSDASDGVPALWNSFSTGTDTATAVGSLPVTSGAHTVRLCVIALHADTSESTDVFVPRVSALWAADGQVSTLSSSQSNDSVSKVDLLERIEKSVEAERG